MKYFAKGSPVLRLPQLPENIWQLPPIFSDQFWTLNFAKSVNNSLYYFLHGDDVMCWYLLGAIIYTLVRSWVRDQYACQRFALLYKVLSVRYRRKYFILKEKIGTRLEPSKSRRLCHNVSTVACIHSVSVFKLKNSKIFGIFLVGKLVFPGCSGNTITDR